jgi:hypothetical protein
VRVSDEEAERIIAKADAEGLNRSDILRAAIDAFMAEEGDRRRGFASFLRRDKQPDVPGEGRINPKDCDHPLSRLLQTGNGVLCDKCGTYV